MSAVTSQWEHVERALRERAYRAIDSQPEILLEGDGGPHGVKAHLIYGRLFGFDDQIDVDGWRLLRIESELLRPIHTHVDWTLSEAALPPAIMRTARYVLQSGYATTQVAAEHLPPGVEFDMTTFTATVLYLRYRRRE